MLFCIWGAKNVGWESLLQMLFSESINKPLTLRKFYVFGHSFPMKWRERGKFHKTGFKKEENFLPLSLLFNDTQDCIAKGD